MPVDSASLPCEGAAHGPSAQRAQICHWFMPADSRLGFLPYEGWTLGSGLWNELSLTMFLCKWPICALFIVSSYWFGRAVF